MLSTKEIADRIQNPELIQKEDIILLKELSEKHPYTQIYSILYLKGLGDTADIHFEEELQKHSYRIGDRTQLFKLIHDFSSPLSSTFSTSSNTSITEEEKEDIIVENEKITETSEEIQQENLTNEEVETEEESIIEKEEEINEVSPLNSETQIHQLEKDDKIEENSIQTLKDPLDESILHHSFASNYKLEELSKEELEKIEQIKDEKESQLPIIEETEKDTTVEIEINATQSFTSWLNSNKNKIETSDNEKLEIEAIVSNSGLTFEINEFFGEIVKPKKEFFSPTKKAKESLSEEALPVSETLAKVYALQGNFPKAIYAYEQLSLKYPEKKIFFAIQIKELQKKLNT